MGMGGWGGGGGMDTLLIVWSGVFLQQLPWETVGRNGEVSAFLIPRDGTRGDT